MEIRRPGSYGLRALDKLPRSKPPVEEPPVVTEVTRPGSTGLDAPSKFLAGKNRPLVDPRRVEDRGGFMRDRAAIENEFYEDVGVGEVKDEARNAQQRRRMN